MAPLKTRTGTRLKFWLHFVLWVPVLFVLPALAVLFMVDSSVVMGVFAGRVPPSAALKALGDWLPFVVFALGAGFIAAHRTAGNFTFGAAYEEQARLAKERGHQWIDDESMFKKTQHISPFTGEVSDGPAMDSKGNMY